MCYFLLLSLYGLAKVILLAECILSREVAHIYLAVRDHVLFFLKHCQANIKVPLSLISKLFIDLDGLDKVPFKYPEQSKVEVVTRHT
jgi:hypothetical protein